MDVPYCFPTLSCIVFTFLPNAVGKAITASFEVFTAVIEYSRLVLCKADGSKERVALVLNRQTLANKGNAFLVTDGDQLPKEASRPKS